MTAAHLAANNQLAALDLRIAGAERELQLLYKQRAGRVHWTKDDRPGFGWCVVCGRAHVQPADGFDTCHVCTLRAKGAIQ